MIRGSEGVPRLISTPSDICNDPSLAAKADVIVLAVPSFAHGQYFEAHLDARKSLVDPLSLRTRIDLALVRKSEKPAQPAVVSLSPCS